MTVEGRHVTRLTVRLPIQNGHLRMIRVGGDASGPTLTAAMASGAVPSAVVFPGDGRASPTAATVRMRMDQMAGAARTRFVRRLAAYIRRLGSGHPQVVRRAEESGQLRMANKAKVRFPACYPEQFWQLRRLVNIMATGADYPPLGAIGQSACNTIRITDETPSQMRRLGLRARRAGPVTTLTKLPATIFAAQQSAKAMLLGPTVNRMAIETEPPADQSQLHGPLSRLRVVHRASYPLLVPVALSTEAPGCVADPGLRAGTAVRIVAGDTADLAICAGPRESILKQRPGQPLERRQGCDRMMRSPRAVGRAFAVTDATQTRYGTGRRICWGAHPKVRTLGIVSRMTQPTRSHGRMHRQGLPQGRGKLGGIVWSPQGVGDFAVAENAQL